MRVIAKKKRRMDRQWRVAFIAQAFQRLLDALCDSGFEIDEQEAA